MPTDTPSPATISCAEPRHRVLVTATGRGTVTANDGREGGMNEDKNWTGMGWGLLVAIVHSVKDEV